MFSLNALAKLTVTLGIVAAAAVAAEYHTHTTSPDDGTATASAETEDHLETGNSQPSANITSNTSVEALLRL